MIRSLWYPQKHKNNNYDNINPTNTHKVLTSLSMKDGGAVGPFLISSLEEDKILNVLLLKRTKSMVLLYFWLKLFLRSNVEIISSFFKEKDISFSLVIFFNISNASMCSFLFSWKVFEGFSPHWAHRDLWPFLQWNLKY